MEIPPCSVHLLYIQCHRFCVYTAALFPPLSQRNGRSLEIFNNASNHMAVRALCEEQARTWKRIYYFLLSFNHLKIQSLEPYGQLILVWSLWVTSSAGECWNSFTEFIDLPRYTTAGDLILAYFHPKLFFFFNSAYQNYSELVFPGCELLHAGCFCHLLLEISLSTDNLAS